MSRPTASSTPQAVLQGYETLLDRTQDMLAAARAADWPALLEQEGAYTHQVDRLARLEAGLALTPAQSQRKAALLERILAHDREIRERLVARRDELGRRIDTSRRQRNLTRAYGVQAATSTPLRLDEGLP